MPGQQRSLDEVQAILARNGESLEEGAVAVAPGSGAPRRFALSGLLEMGPIGRRTWGPRPLRDDTGSAQVGTRALQRAPGLAEGLLEGPADRHDLADGLHGRGEDRVGLGELLEGEAGELDDHVVERGLERGRA